MPHSFDSYVAQLGKLRIAGEPLPVDLDSSGPAGETSGYAAQAALADWFRANGQGDVAGYKIGATTDHMQALLGVTGPVYGRIMSANVQESPAAFRCRMASGPAVECEVAFRIGKDFPDTPVTRADAAARIDSVIPGIEFVENRYGDYRARSLGTLTADDFFHKACALGPPVAGWRNLHLPSLSARVRVDGAEVATGRGGNVMGDPLNAVLWLAGMLAEQGERLKSGQIVFTGAVAPVYWLKSLPARAEIHIEGLGACTAEFTAPA